jgi:hypothetical protein
LRPSTSRKPIEPRLTGKFISARSITTRCRAGIHLALYPSKFELDNRETIHSEPFPLPTESGKIHHGHGLGIPRTQGQFGLPMEKKRYGFHAPATRGGQKQILARYFLPDQQQQLQLSRNTSEEMLTLQTIRTFLPRRTDPPVPACSARQDEEIFHLCQQP